MLFFHDIRGTSRRQFVAAAAGGYAGLATHRFAQAGEPTAPAELIRVVRWARQAQRMVVKYQQNPLRAARAFAYVQVAMHEAWKAAGTAGMGPLAAERAAHRAASLLLAQLYPNETPGQFEAQFAWACAAAGAMAPSAATQASDMGVQVASKLIERSLRDGAGRGWGPKLRPAAFNGMWQPAYPLFAVNPTEGMAPHWRTWFARGPHRYDPPPPARPGDAGHAQETQEVLDVSRSLTEAQRRTAERWNLEAGSVTPAGVWLDWTLSQLGRPSDDDAVSLSDALRIVATVTTTMHDAFIDCWRVKLRHWSERPITAVRRSLDATFVPALVTPGFPAYVSGHATVSAAASTVLSELWPQHAPRLRQMAEEAAMSRLWGGIHFRSDNEEGLRLGRSVGADALAASRIA